MFSSVQRADTLAGGCFVAEVYSLHVMSMFCHMSYLKSRCRVGVGGCGSGVVIGVCGGDSGVTVCCRGGLPGGV